MSHMKPIHISIFYYLEYFSLLSPILRFGSHACCVSRLLNSTLCPKLYVVMRTNGRSQWPRGLRRRSTAARLLRSWVRIPPGSWKFVCCECCVLSGRGLCDELITRSEESYRPWCVVVCDIETTKILVNVEEAKAL